MWVVVWGVREGGREQEGAGGSRRRMSSSRRVVPCFLGFRGLDEREVYMSSSSFLFFFILMSSRTGRKARKRARGRDGERGSKKK